MQIHLLTGDSLAEKFFKLDVSCEIIVSRECLIEGSLEGATLAEFWQTRARFIESAYGADENSFNQNVKTEYQKLLALGPQDEANLWFEYDLFCQVNMWFALYLLSQSKIKDVYRVAPTMRTQNDLWKGFGNLDEQQLRECLAHKIKFQKDDITLGKNLWQAYKNDNLIELKRLSEVESNCFPYLKEVCKAQIERKQERRPENSLKEIAANGVTDFHELFARFSEKEGIYGFGDSQVKRILNSAAFS
ncbi:MAG: DUF1835 domain-containing protein [Pyrinomonadaceae bacterium]